jgi:adenylate kinase
MRILLMGPPGAGKGTQAAKIAAHFGIPHISTGDIFRAAINSGSELGKKLKQFLDSGQLVPDEVTIAVVRERLEQPDCEDGFLLDGFPRTIPQAEALDKMLEQMGKELDIVLNISVAPEIIVQRLSGRRICRNCGATYHVKFQPPRQPGVCDHCGGELYQRSDDNEETVKERLDVYTKQTAPLLDYYRERGLLYQIDGDQSIDQVWSEIERALRSIKR